MIAIGATQGCWFNLSRGCSGAHYWSCSSCIPRLAATPTSTWRWSATPTRSLPRAGSSPWSPPPWKLPTRKLRFSQVRKIFTRFWTFPLQAMSLVSSPDTNWFKKPPTCCSRYLVNLIQDQFSWSIGLLIQQCLIPYKDNYLIVLSYTKLVVEGWALKKKKTNQVSL